MLHAYHTPCCIRPAVLQAYDIPAPAPLFAGATDWLGLRSALLPWQRGRSQLHFRSSRVRWCLYRRAAWVPRLRALLSVFGCMQQSTCPVSTLGCPPAAPPARLRHGSCLALRCKQGGCPAGAHAGGCGAPLRSSAAELGCSPSGAGEEAAQLVSMLEAVGRGRAAERLYCAARLPPLQRVWEGYAAGTPFASWLPGFYDHVRRWRCAAVDALVCWCAMHACGLRCPVCLNCAGHAG